MTQTDNTNFQNILMFDEIQSIASKAQEVLNRVDTFKQNRKELFRKYKELNESEDPNYREKIERLYLHGFEKVISYTKKNANISESEYLYSVEYELTGPSCRSANVILNVSALYSRGNYDNVRVKVNIQLENPYRHNYRDVFELAPIHDDKAFIKNLITIHKHLGFKELSLNELWMFLLSDHIKSNGSISDDISNHSLCGEETIEQYLKNAKIDLIDTNLSSSSVLGKFVPTIHQNDEKIMNSIYEVVRRNDTSFTLHMFHNEIISAAKLWGLFIKYIPVEELKSKIFMEILRHRNYLIPEIITTIYEQSNVEFCNELLKLNPEAFPSLPLHIRVNTTLLDTCIREATKICVAQYLPTEYQDNSSLMLKCLEQSEETLKYISERLKSDKEFIMEALNIRPSIISGISEPFKCDTDILAKAVDVAVTMKRGFYVPDNISIELAMKMASSGLLKFLPQKLRSNRDIVMAAINFDPQQFQYASKDLRADCDIVRIAISQNEQAKQFVAPELLFTQEFEYLLRGPFVIKSLDKHTYLKLLRYYENRDTVTISELLLHAPEDIKQDKQTILQKLHTYGNIKIQIPKHLKNDLCIRKMEAVRFFKNLTFN
jgi:hypothetical protein